MKIYFIRHGESEYNTVDMHQHREVRLSSYGIKQVQKVAGRIQKLPIDVIFSSHYKRAKQTAEIIGKAIGQRVRISKLLHEFKRPTEVENKSYYDPEVMRIKKIIKEHTNDPEYHYSDEENFFDFQKRVQSFWSFISKQKEENILVVTHAFFLRMLISDFLFGDNLTPDIYGQFATRIHHINTGITVYERSKEGNWRLLTWGDYAHLG